MKKKRFLFCLVIALTMLSFTGCQYVLFFTGSRTERYLYNARKTIRQHHKKWVEKDGMSRSVAGEMLKPTEEMLDDNMDYLAQNDWITGFEYYTGGITDELLKKYDIIKGYNHPFVVITTNNDVTYVIPAYKDYNSDEPRDWKNPYIYVNDGFSFVDGIYPEWYRYIDADEDEVSFYYFNAMYITNKFPYPVSMRFSTDEVTLHQDEENPYRYYWGYDFTGDPNETYRTLEPVTTEEWLLECEDGNIERELYDLRLSKAYEMGWWNWDEVDPVKFYEELYSYNESNVNPDDVRQPTRW